MKRLIVILLVFCSANVFAMGDSLYQLKYPVILVHGIVATDRPSVIDFWGNIPDTLEQYGIDVFVGETDAWGTVESNADILNATIERVLAETGQPKVNIIAHSKGGLDARFCIWKYHLGDKVASLTTIGTPHHGSEVIDLVMAQDFVHSKFFRIFLNVFGVIYGDRHPDMYRAGQESTTAYMKKFNRKVVKDPSVFYQSLHLVLARPEDDWMLSKTWKYLQENVGANDGFISVKSTLWGDTTNLIDGSISHNEISDYKKKLIRGFDIPSIYLKIVKGLVNRGF